MTNVTVAITVSVADVFLEAHLKIIGISFVAFSIIMMVTGIITTDLGKAESTLRMVELSYEK